MECQKDALRLEKDLENLHFSTLLLDQLRLKL